VENAEELNPIERWDRLQQAVRSYASMNRIPYKASFELTARCSLKCKMCYMRLDEDDIKLQGRELTTDEWIKLGEMAAKAGTVDLLLTGGEPMLRRDFKEIYTALTDLGFLMRVYTNATLVDDDILKLFEERPPHNVEVSIYGASRETYHAIAGWADGYDRMAQGVDGLLSVLPSIKLKTTIIRDNAPDFAAMVDFARKRNVLLSTVSLPCPAIRGARADVISHRLNLQELLTFHAKNNFDMMNDSCTPPPLEERSGIYCDAGLSSYSILWHGAMVACMTDGDPDPVRAYPLEVGFAAAWEKIKDFRCGKEVLPEECKTCEVYAECSSCAVHHHMETGSYTKRNRYGCDFYRISHGLPLI
jgi:radical SAM protein with 4Fe4S-binding SPASM domain